jgi:hypothetical protein
VFAISEEEEGAVEALIERFLGEPKVEDFQETEKEAAFFRSAPGPMPGGGAWLEWFYQKLQAPKKRDVDSWNKHFEKLDRWRAAFPDSPTPLTVAARAHITRGWEERGTAYANTVSEARWIIFHDELERAAKLAERARAMAGHDADAARP